MKSDIKLLITSDLHLGIKDSPVPIELRLRTFQKITALAKDCNMLLICGDFIDNADIDDSIIEEINDEFYQLKSNNVAVVLCPGKGEINKIGGLAPAVKELEVTHLFSEMNDRTPFKYQNDGTRVFVYGAPATMGQDVLKIRKVPEEGFHIGLFYVDFNPETENRHGESSRIFKMKKDDIKNIGLDFYAFGSNHNFKMFKVQEKIIAAYPGSPEATSFSDTGDRFVVTMTIRGNAVHSIKRLAVNSISVEEMTFECAINNMKAINTKIERSKSKKVDCTVTLKGTRNFNFSPVMLDKYRDAFFGFHVRDLSSPTFDLLFDGFGSEESVRGELLRIMKEKIQNGNVPEKVIMEDVLRILNYMIHGNTDSLEDWLCNI